MRVLAASSISLLLAACATAPRPGVPTPTPQTEHTRGPIIGQTANDLVRRWGTPALQIREGDSLKLQFRSSHCVLDAYLYSTDGAPHRVTYVDTRNRALADVDQALCIRSLETP